MFYVFVRKYGDRLVDHIYKRPDLFLGLQFSRNIHRNNRIAGKYLFRRLDGKIRDESSVDKQPVAYGPRVEERGDGHGSSHGRREASRAEHYLLSSLKIRRDGCERHRKLVETNNLNTRSKLCETFEQLDAGRASQRPHDVARFVQHHPGHLVSWGNTVGRQRDENGVALLGEKIRKIEFFDDMAKFVGSIAAGGKPSYDRAHACSDDAGDRNPLLLKRLENAYVRKPPGSSAGEGQYHASALRERRTAIHQLQQKQRRKHPFSKHRNPSRFNNKTSICKSNIS